MLVYDLLRGFDLAAIYFYSAALVLWLGLLRSGESAALVLWLGLLRFGNVNMYMVLVLWLGLLHQHVGSYYYHAFVMLLLLSCVCY